MKTINKDKIAETLKQNLGLSKSLCQNIVDNVFGEILQIISSGKSLTITNFGRFNIVHKKERPGINFHTKTAVIVPAKHIIRFVASEYLKKKINHDN